MSSPGKPVTGPSVAESKKGVSAESGSAPAPDYKPETALQDSNVQLQANRGRSFRIRLTAVALMFLALLVFTIVITSPQFRPQQAQKPSEVETMKQELVRVQQQREALQRERDDALEAARREQEKRLLEVQQALDAARQEVEAIEAATQAEMQAEEVANEQRLEQERQRADRERKEAEKLKAELERQREEQEQRKAEIEQELLELEIAREEKLAPEEEQRRVAREQAELFRALEELESTAAAASESPEPVKQDNQSFTTDPCSSPSAKFLSTCN